MRKGFDGISEMGKLNSPGSLEDRDEVLVKWVDAWAETEEWA